jgi:SAM-dependent methyltransferase
VNDLDLSATAYEDSFPFHDENLRMLAWYAARMLETLREAHARSLLSLGVGHRVVCRALLDGIVPQLDRYHVVEGSQVMLDRLRSEQQLPDNVALTRAHFEEFDPGATFDAIEMGFVLEHVEDPRLVVERFARFLEPGATLFVAVPNARSLHRLLGHAAGLLDDVYALSSYDLELGHRRYFDRRSLETLLRDAGLRVKRTEGVFLKCLPTRQLASLELPEPVQRAFYEVGAGLPDVCNSLYVEATR